MNYIPINDVEYALFHGLLTDYYREGEDVDTPQEQIDEMVECLYDLCLSGQISGCIAAEEEPVGFVLWMTDTEDSPFSQLTGYGTILEIGITKSSRNSGIGRKLVEYAESKMPTAVYYVCAYGPAEHFWIKCGYSDTGRLAANGLKLMTKGDGIGR